LTEPESSPVSGTTDGAGYVVVHLQGALDFKTTPPIHNYLIDIAASGRDAVVIDLENVTFLESTAIGIFVATHRRLREQQRRFALVNAMGRVASTLRIAALHKAMPVVFVEAPERPWERQPTVDELLAEFGIYG
jgi:anti-sigma B factor antagonist